mmetsp:Transcript_25177/g.81225  ORF Transcript_25177/g.81225 Transcript_25177/m.81225 type:complete len:207 (+) Transcript_25177:1241-1861(+)
MAPCTCTARGRARSTTSTPPPCWPTTRPCSASRARQSRAMARSTRPVASTTTGGRRRRRSAPMRATTSRPPATQAWHGTVEWLPSWCPTTRWCRRCAWPKCRAWRTCWRARGTRRSGATTRSQGSCVRQPQDPATRTAAWTWRGPSRPSASLPPIARQATGTTTSPTQRSPCRRRSKAPWWWLTLARVCSTPRAATGRTSGMPCHC